MCSSKLSSDHNSSTDHMARINGRPVLQPTGNRVQTVESHNSIKKISSPKSPKKLAIRASPSTSPPISPKTPSPKKQSSHGLSFGNDKILITKPKSSLKKSSSSSSSSSDSSPPGSIANARREQVANMQEMRKMKIAHYGRKKSLDKKGVLNNLVVGVGQEEKRCSFITPNSDPIYVAYHDEEWGVPVYEDKMLFELLVLTTAQVGSDWTSVLKKRVLLRDAFSGFDEEMVASFRERKITSISHDYDIELCQVRGAVDNANQILKIKKEFGSFSSYLWRFVNNKAMSTKYKTWQKVPVKTSKSESISKDLVKRGFRFVGPAVIHSFMQAAGLTNDHLLTCPRHLLCSHQPTNQ